MPIQQIPFVSGYDNQLYFAVTSVRATYRFAGTDPSVIQSDNSLRAGIYSATFTTNSGEDWGFQGVLILNHNGQFSIAAQVDQVCEGLPATCSLNGLPWDNTVYALSQPLSAGVNDYITLTLGFVGATCYFWYQINGGSMIAFGTYTVPSQVQHNLQTGKFNAGWLWRYVWAKYFQFGVSSNYNIGHGGWYVYITQQQYQVGGSWTAVAQAAAAQGANSYFDAIWTWGFSTYNGVYAYYQHNVGYPPDDIMFYYSGSSTLADGTILWG
jgi:hypothetical protein